MNLCASKSEQYWWSYDGLSVVVFNGGALTVRNQKRMAIYLYVGISNRTGRVL